MENQQLKFKPTNNFITVKPVDEEVTESGIILPKIGNGENGTGTEFGQVISVADNADQKYKSVKMILYPKSARGVSYQEDNGKKYRFVHEDDVIAFE